MLFAYPAINDFRLQGTVFLGAMAHSLLQGTRQVLRRKPTVGTGRSRSALRTQFVSTRLGTLFGSSLTTTLGTRTLGSTSTRQQNRWCLWMNQSSQKRQNKE